MRKSIFIFLAALCCATISAEIINGTCGDLTYSLNTETGTLSFDGNGAMANFADISDRPWNLYIRDVTTVRFWGNPTTIGTNAFYNCTNLTTCNFPSTLTSIGDYAFYNCPKLEVSISFSYGLVAIGVSAFQKCEKITDFYFPASLINIGENAFQGCYGVTFYQGSDENEYFSFPGSVLCNKAQTKIIAYPVARNQTTYTMPGTVTSVGDYAFEKASILTSITMSPKLEDIGDSAFRGCKALIELNLPATVNKLGNWAFQSCKGLIKITSLAQTPPVSVGFYPFNGVNVNIPVYVPKGTIDAYKEAIGWRIFTNFQETTAIDQTFDKSQMSNAKYINNGQLFIQRGDELFNAQGARVK